MVWLQQQCDLPAYSTVCHTRFMMSEQSSHVCWMKIIELIWNKRRAQKSLQSQMQIWSCQLPRHGVSCRSRCLNKLFEHQTCWIGESLLAGMTTGWLTWELASTTAFLEQHFPITTPHHIWLLQNTILGEHFKLDPRHPPRLTWDCSGLGRLSRNNMNSVLSLLCLSK